MQFLEAKKPIRQRVLDTLHGRKPDRLPFIDRLEIWYKNHMRSGTLSQEYAGMSLTQVHAAVGMGQQVFLTPYSLKFPGVEVIYQFEGDILHRESDPVLEFFPAHGHPKYLDLSKPGITTAEFVTPVGKVRVAYEVNDQMYYMGIAPYIREHLIKEDGDYRTVEYMLERVEYIPHYDTILEEETKIGEIGYVIPEISRIPFQQILLEYLGELNLFYALYDSPNRVSRLMAVLDELLTEILHKLCDSPFLYFEFSDNLHGSMTNPRLFQKYCLPYYQRYAEIMHSHDKKIGSHTDGDLSLLLHLLAESGLDICESFAPAPLTGCNFEDAWQTWRHGPIIWGGIPSPILEERTPEENFRAYIDQLLKTVGDGPIILGVSDMVVGNNMIERVRYIAEQVERHELHH